MTRPASQDDVRAIYQAILGREPENQEVVDGFLAQGVDVGSMIAQALQSDEYRARFSYRSFDGPPVPMLIRPPPERPKGHERVAVLVRTHVIEDKFLHLCDELNKPERQYDLYPLIDSRDVSSDEIEAVKARYGAAIGFRLEDYPGLGLHQRPAHDLFWLCGDFPMFTAAQQHPIYDYYVMIDYDVYFTSGGADYLNRLCERLLSPAHDMLDGVGLEFRERKTGVDWPFYEPAARVFPNVFFFYFPFIALSLRAVMHLLAQRQLESARRPPADQVVICEAFVPSSLVAAGFNCADLNAVLPGSYTMEGMGLQHYRSYKLSGVPIGHAEVYPEEDVEMMHAVYSSKQFLKRNLKHSSETREGLELFIDWVSHRYAASLDGELVGRYVAAARERLAAFG